jgi:formylglycine-generating enzyme required for sulfatase activity
VFGRDGDGRFVLKPDADGDVWDPENPVVLVDWIAACAYAQWLSERIGQPWRLPGELEWEKAARGVDGRCFPWGDAFDASWCCMRASRRARPLPAVVDSFPVDTSVYGVRGLGGNVQDWCADAFSADGPVAVSPPWPYVGDAPGRVVRGGYWHGAADLARSADRSKYGPGNRSELLGFRVVSCPP